MANSDPRRRPDLMGGPDEPADVLEGGEEPAGESRDVLRPGSPEQEKHEEHEDVLDDRER